MKSAMFFQDLSTAPPSSSMETGLTLSHYIKLTKISYFWIWDMYLNILIPVRQHCLFRVIPLLAQLLLMSGLCCKSHFFVSLLQPQGEWLIVSHDVIQAFYFQRMASPSLNLGDLLKLITLQQPTNKRVI